MLRYALSKHVHKSDYREGIQRSIPYSQRCSEAGGGMDWGNIQTCFWLGRGGTVGGVDFGGLLG